MGRIARLDQMSLHRNSSRKKRSKDKSKSKDKHRSKHRSHEEYEPSTFDNRVLPNMAGPSTSRIGDNLPQARRPDHTTYPPSAEYPPPPHTPQNQDPPSYGGYMQRPSYPPYPQEGHPPREPPPGYTPLQHREHPSMDYAPQPPDHRRYSQEGQPPHEQYERVTHENTRSPSAMSTREPQNQSSESADTSQNNVKPRIPRLITLLIEDMRLKESQLAEVRVPLKERPGDLIWADAVDITEALQAGPSRIDGPAKVSTMRGEFKQIFFRVSANGDVNCSSANVQVSPEKTVKVLVEDPDRALALHQYRTSAGMLRVTPNNDPMMAPPGMLPAPQSVPPGRFDSDQYDRSLDERRPSSSRKRPRSVSQEATHPRTSQPRPPCRDVPPEPPKYQSSGGPPPPQRAARHATSRSPTPVSGSGSSSDSTSPSGSDASPNAQPSQISPLSQAGSLTQMSPASIPNQEMAPCTPTARTDVRTNA
ncbi:hypothetical protein BC629DRAFT_934786 [Irpex lacteus]|nr:hypothetical protein BC629DRAFT_934786 [Irpex lacteus]